MEKNIMEHTFFDDLLNEEIIVIDLGACKGEFINELEKNYKIKKAVLVEANPSNFKHLTEKDNHILYNRVISNESDSLVKFYEDPKSPYNGTKFFNYFDGIEHHIPTITIEDIIKENNITYIDILKIDIEGSEYEIMPSISDETYNIINQITIEFHDFINTELKKETEKIIDKLEKMGFSRISKPIIHMNNSDNYDVLFYRSKKI
jgi:FkbM family methyltransferase